MASDETLLRAGTGTGRFPKPGRRVAVGAAAAALIGAAGEALLFSGTASPPAQALSPARTELARLMRDVARQVEMQVPLATSGGATILGASASGERLIFRMRLGQEVAASDAAAVQARLAAADATEICRNSDMRWLIEQGSTIERNYAGAGGVRLRTETRSCAGQAGGAAKAEIPVAM